MAHRRHPDRRRQRHRLEGSPARQELEPGEPAGDELHRALLGPVADPQRARPADEAGVPAVPRRHEADRARGVRGHAVEDRRREERVVLGREAERRRRDPGDPVQGARRVVVVLRAPEAVERRGHRVVEVEEGPGRSHLRDVETGSRLRVPVQELPGLLPQAAQERRGVDGSEPLLELPRARLEVVRDRDRRGRGEAGLARVLAQPLQEDVSAERDADRRERDARLRGDEGRDEVVEVGRLPRVVETRGRGSGCSGRDSADRGRRSGN